MSILQSSIFVIRDAGNLLEYLSHFRMDKIKQLCSVMGATWINASPKHDPNRAYELTPDNVMKILAIHMRLR